MMNEVQGDSHKNTISSFYYSEWHGRMEPALIEWDALKNAILFAKDGHYIEEGVNLYPKRYKTIIYEPNFINKALQPNMYIFEVLPVELPRRFYVDIDVKEESPVFLRYTYSELVEATINVVQEAYKKVTQQEFDVAQVATSVVENTTHKQSIHMTFPIYLSNHMATLRFAQVVLNTVDPDDILAKDLKEPLLDMSVYSRNQCFRCLNQSKYGKQDYTLTPFEGAPQDPVDHLVGLYGDIRQYHMVDEQKLNHVSNTCIHELKQRSFKNNMKDTESIRRFISQHYEVFTDIVYYDPELIRENINMDTTDDVLFYLSCIPNSNEKPQKYSLWYSIGQALKNISHDDGQPDKYLQEWIDWSNLAAGVYGNETRSCTRAWKGFTVKPKTEKRYTIRFITTIAEIYAPNIQKHRQLNMNFKDMFLTSPYHALFDETYVYNERYCQEYDPDIPIEVSQSPMGSGKTVCMKKLCIRSDTNEEIPRYNRVLLVSPRKTFSREKVAEFAQILSGFKDYSDQDVQESYDWLDFDRLAIQVESLHRLEDINIHNNYDLVILDEIESILYQFSSTTNKEPQINFNVFVKVVAYAEKVVMADAFITNRTLQFALDVKAVTGKKTKLAVNLYRPQGMTAHVLGIAKSMQQAPIAKTMFAQHVIKSLMDNKKLCVVIGSKSFKDELIQEVVDHMLRYKKTDFTQCIRDYDSLTDDQVMKQLTNVNELWVGENVKLLIYTSKITVGISFTVPDDFDATYIYGSFMCPIARDLIQAHFRVRHTKSKTLYVALYVSASEGAQQQHTLSSVTMRNMYISGHFHKKKSKFDNKQYKRMYFKLVDYNALEEELGQCMYEEVFLHFLKETGYNIQYGAKGGDHANKKSVTTPTYDYKECYNRAKTLSSLQANDLEDKQKHGNATCMDKLTLKAYHFKRIHTRGLKKDINAIMERYPTFDYDLFNLYASDKLYQNFMDNIIDEVYTNNINTELTRQAYCVMTTQGQTLRVKYIKDMCSILGIHNSLDTSSTISGDKMENLFQYYCDDKQRKELITKLFKVKEKDAKEHTKRQLGKMLFNTIIRYWNGGKVQAKRQQMRQGTNRSEVYTYNIDFKSVKEIDEKYAEYCNMRLQRRLRHIAKAQTVEHDVDNNLDELDV